MRTEILNSDAVEHGAQLLRAGELVAFATETVYGLGADARRDDAVRKIYAAKGRPSGNPLIVHVPGLAAAIECAVAAADSSGSADGAVWFSRLQALAEKFWPGPLTLVVPRGSSLSPLVSAGRDTVALRAPAHPAAQALLKAFGGPIAAPSANRSGFTSPTTAQHVLAELGGRVSVILDGGACEIGLESTVVDITCAIPRILRPGAITAEMLQGVIGAVETVHATVREEDSAVSPGQHHRHYAPRTPARTFRRDQWPVPLAGRSVLITHDPAIHLGAPHEVIVLPGDPAGYARALYACLRQADELQLSSILILAPDNRDGLWAAIADRLSRAAEPL